MKIHYYFLLICAVTSCVKNENNTDQISEEKTKAVLNHHWIAFQANDLEATMEDYVEESVLITPNATYTGLDQIRENFVDAFKMFPKDSSSLTLNKSLAVKDVGYILWQAKTPGFNLSYATDTFIIRDGKIIRQTYAGVAQ
ncbi:MAG: nuclear transport factor 2 family protein [Cyclobacteriaceae bacterium]